MTQYIDKVEKRREELKEEELDKQVKFIEVRYKKGKCSQMTVGYNSGREVTEYNDKRKKDKVEWQ